jgi:hypothetical protein
LMRADSLRGEGGGGGLALEIESFVGPCARALCLLLFEGTFTSFFKDKKQKEVTKQ